MPIDNIPQHLVVVIQNVLKHIHLLSLPNFTLDILVPGKAVKRRGGYGLQIPLNFIFVTRP